MAETTERTEQRTQEREDKVRQSAYLNWLAKTGGNPVDDDQTNEFWFEAEKQIETGDGEANTP